jgi:hypothetical protein
MEEWCPVNYAVYGFRLSWLCIALKTYIFLGCYSDHVPSKCFALQGCFISLSLRWIFHQERVSWPLFFTTFYLAFTCPYICGGASFHAT